MKARTFMIGIALLTAACAESTITKPPVSEPLPMEVAPKRSSKPQPDPDGAKPKAAVVAATAPAPRPPKVVSLSLYANEVDEPQSVTVRVGDTLEITVPVWPGTVWKVVGDAPLSTDFIQSWLGPNTHGMKHVWTIAGAPGKRTLKLVGTDVNSPNDEPHVAKIAVTVE